MTNCSVFVRNDGTVHVGASEMPEVLPKQALIRMAAGAVSTGTEITGMIRMRKHPEPPCDPRRLGYSGAGVVESVGAGYSGPPVGSPVAVYGGPYVSHSHWCAVGQNLIAPAQIPLEQAAFGGIGAIAMHAVRLAEVTLGERVGVLGLGVLGQFVSQLAHASGAWILASDPLASRRDTARQLGADKVTTPEEFETAALDFSHGEGLDAVLVVAGTPDSAAPAQQGLRVLRYRGRLQIVGNVKTEWLREELFQKEVSIRVSRAAGPGRYNPDYERDGNPWPPGIEPWTEGRNLQSFVTLVAGGRIRVSPLITASYPVDEAGDAYDRLIYAPNDNLAIVLRLPGVQGQPT